jgi:putative flippase GtrA
MLSAIAQRRGLRQFVKFGIVGLSGLLVNLIVFTVLQRLDPNHAETLHYNILYTIGFLSGGVSNYYLNRIWTFRSTGHAVREGAQFLTVSTIALLVGIGLNLLLHPYLGNGHRMWLVATLGGVLVNFFLNKYWTFKHLN